MGSLVVGVAQSKFQIRALLKFSHNGIYNTILLLYGFFLKFQGGFYLFLQSFFDSCNTSLRPSFGPVVGRPEGDAEAVVALLLLGHLAHLEAELAEPVGIRRETCSDERTT